MEKRVPREEGGNGRGEPQLEGSSGEARREQTCGLWRSLPRPGKGQGCGSWGHRSEGAEVQAPPGWRGWGVGRGGGQPDTCPAQTVRARASFLASCKSRLMN